MTYSDVIEFFLVIIIALFLFALLYQITVVFSQEKFKCVCPWDKCSSTNIVGKKGEVKETTRSNLHLFGFGDSLKGWVCARVITKAATKV
jgi:hypothetical protein